MPERQKTAFSMRASAIGSQLPPRVTLRNAHHASAQREGGETSVNSQIPMLAQSLPITVEPESLVTRRVRTKGRQQSYESKALQQVPWFQHDSIADYDSDRHGSDRIRDRGGHACA